MEIMKRSTINRLEPPTLTACVLSLGVSAQQIQSYFIVMGVIKEETLELVSHAWQNV